VDSHTRRSQEAVAAGLLGMRKYKPDNKAHSAGLQNREKWASISFVKVEWDSIVCAEAD
jgi:hypothetical protein